MTGFFTLSHSQPLNAPLWIKPIAINKPQQTHFFLPLLIYLFIVFKLKSTGDECLKISTLSNSMEMCTKLKHLEKLDQYGSLRKWIKANEGWKRIHLSN